MAINEREALELIGEFHNADLGVEQDSMAAGTPEERTAKCRQDAQIRLHIASAALFKALTGNTPSPDVIHDLLGNEFHQALFGVE